MKKLFLVFSLFTLIISQSFAQNRPTYYIAAPLLYSGMPNPSWKLIDKDLIDDINDIIANTEPIEQISKNPPALGYNGFLLENPVTGEDGYSRVMVHQYFEVYYTDGRILYFEDTKDVESRLIKIAHDKGFYPREPSPMRIWFSKFFGKILAIFD